MKTRELKMGDVLVIGHEASDTMTVTDVRPLDIEWSERGSVRAKPDSAYDVTGELPNGNVRTITLQGDDEVEV